MQLTEILDHVPDHHRIGIVEEVKKGMFHTIYSGYSGNFEHFYQHGGCISPLDYIVTTIHAGSWDNKAGLVIGVKRDEE